MTNNLYTVSAYKDSISGILSGLDLANVQDLNGAIERASKVMIQKADIPEACGIQNIVLYAGVTDYACDTNIFGPAINDIRPQGTSRPPWDSTTKTYSQQFDRYKNFYPMGTTSTFQYSNGIPTIRIKAPFVNQSSLLDPMTTIGNWVASGTATGLTTDYTNYWQSPASLRFQLATGAGILTDNASSTLNISTYEDIGVAFLAIYMPSGASNLTSITLKVGSSSGDYNDVTVTAPFIGTFTDNLWQLVAFDFANASQTGTPDWSAIDYLQLTFNATGTIPNFHVGDLFMSLPNPSQILFQSAAIFLPVGSTTPLTTITANTDIITLANPAYNIFLYEGALAILENTSGAMGDAMTERINRKLNGDGTDKNLGLYALYRGDNPSQELRQTEPYYNSNVGGWMGYGNANGSW